MMCGIRKASAALRHTRGRALSVTATTLFLLPGTSSGSAEAQAGALLPTSSALSPSLRSVPPVSPEVLPDAPLPDANSLALARQSSQTGAGQGGPSEPAQGPAQAAAATAVLTGVVSDMSGGLIVGAQVKLVSKDGTFTRESKSDAQGRYSFNGLAAGSYTVTVSSPGLETIVLSDMPVAAGDTMEVPEVPLPVARAKADVEVYAGQEQVAAAQLHIQEQQRVLGVFPNFYTSFIWDAAPLNRKQKFNLMFHSTLDPVQFGTVAIVAGVEQLGNRFPAYGDGAQGYAKRYGAAYADAFIGRFLGSAVFPSIFGQDPRYFYQGTGTVSSRAWHAISSAIICRGDSGHRQFHYSHVLGNFSAGAISNLYHPGADRGIGLTVGNAVIGLGGSAAVNLVREFVLKGFTHKVPGYANGKPPNDVLKQ